MINITFEWLLPKPKPKPKPKYKTIKLEKVFAEFKTVDGEMHRTLLYKWFNKSALLCSVGEYIMAQIKKDGYIKDNHKKMYPLSNVISIEWLVVDIAEINEKVIGGCSSCFPQLQFENEYVEAHRGKNENA